MILVLLRLWTHWLFSFDFFCGLIVVSVFARLLVSASQDGKLIIWDSYTTNKVNKLYIFYKPQMMSPK